MSVVFNRKKGQVVRSNRVASDLSDSGDVLKGACIGDAFDELLAHGLKTAFRNGGHSDGAEPLLSFCLIFPPMHRCLVVVIGSRRYSVSIYPTIYTLLDRTGVVFFFDEDQNPYSTGSIEKKRKTGKKHTQERENQIAEQRASQSPLAQVPVRPSHTRRVAVWGGRETPRYLRINAALTSLHSLWTHGTRWGPGVVFHRLQVSYCTSSEVVLCTVALRTLQRPTTTPEPEDLSLGRDNVHAELRQFPCVWYCSLCHATERT
ncbi:hypothetical protein VTO42DRAFT_8544 [Malbranchea cinnamomea]